MYKSKKTGIVGIIITITILTLVVVFSNAEYNSSFFGNAIDKIVSPLQNGLAYLKNKVSGNQSFFSDIQKLKDENGELKKKNSELEQSLRELEIIKSENETLKESLGLKEKYAEYKAIPGYIISKDISNYSKTFIINIGSRDGVEENMTVIADKGLVGHIISVTENTSKVRTIVDTASSTSCILSTSNDSVVAKGILDSDKELKAMYVSSDTNLIQGDTVQTSGIGGIYPRGILVGNIKRIVDTQNITDRYAIIETAVDFNKINAILVVKAN